MGFFSFETSDTKKSISNIYSNRNAFDVYLLFPNGEKVKESNYEGYGIFGGYDVYELLAKWNRPDQCVNKDHDSIRRIGIELYFNKEIILKYPIKLVENGNLNYDEVEESKQCSKQGFFY